MASFRSDGVLYDPMRSISRRVDRAINMNKDIARTNTQTLIDLEKEKQRSIREITRLQRSLAASSLCDGKKKLHRFSSVDESEIQNCTAVEELENGKKKVLTRQRTSSDLWNRHRTVSNPESFRARTKSLNNKPKNKDNSNNNIIDDKSVQSVTINRKLSEIERKIS